MSTPAQQVRTRVPRIAEAAVRRARLSVVPRRPATAARVPFITLVTLLLVGGVVGLLLFNTSMQQAAFAATKLERQATVLTAREQTLQQELEELRDPQRVARAAARQGMVPARNAAFLRLPDGQVLGSPTVATAADGLRIDALPQRRTGTLLRQQRVVELPPSALLPAMETRGDTGAGSPVGAASAGRNGVRSERAGGRVASNPRGASAVTPD